MWHCNVTQPGSKSCDPGAQLLIPTVEDFNPIKMKLSALVKRNLPQGPWRCWASSHFSSLTEQSAAMISCISVIFTSSSGISTSTIGIFSSSWIFSAEELRLESLSISSSISEMRSETQWAVRRASGSWSQHSMMVAQITATPCRGRSRAGVSSSKWQMSVKGLVYQSTRRFINYHESSAIR